MTSPPRTLLFAYTALLDPEQLTRHAPGARFVRIAHLPESALAFTVPGGSPTVVTDESATVWGAVFEVDTGLLERLAAAEAAGGVMEQRVEQVVDRAGGRHEVVLLAAAANGQTTDQAPRQHLEAMVRGARHWELPAGWVMGLEDLLDPFPL